MPQVRSELLMHNAFDEIPVRHPCHPLIEMTDETLLDARLPQQLQFFAQAGQARRRLIGREELLRLRFKRHRGCQQIALSRLLYHAREYGLVAQVDTVEVTDRQRHRLIGPRRRPPQYAHIETSGLGQKF